MLLRVVFVLFFAALCQRGQSPTIAPLRAVAAESLSFTASSLSPSGKFVAVAGNDGSISILTKDGNTRTLRDKLHAQMDSIAFSWSEDETRLLISDSHHLEVIDPRSLKLESSYASSAAMQCAQLSPDGHWISVVRDKNLWLASPSTTSFRAITDDTSGNVFSGAPDAVFAREFDVHTHHWFAPDSSSLAYIETTFDSPEHDPKPGAKLPRFRLKLVALAGRQIETLAESSDDWPYLVRVAWLPDSRRIAFYRMNRLQNTAQLCLWEKGAVRVIFTDHDDYWINAPDAPLLTPDGQKIIVTSERSGHRQLYLYSIAGTLLRELTPADYEVSALLHTDLANGFAYFTGATGTLQEQHLFRVSVEGAKVERLSQTPGWHQPSLNLSGDVFLDRFSTAQTPERISWYANGSLRRTIHEQNSAEPPPQNEYAPIKTHDGILLPARLFKPPDFDEHKKYPVLLYTFSGPRGRVVADSWGGWQMAWNRYMVRRGYLVLAVDVRGAGGYSHLFEEYIHYRFGAQETVDLREVVSFLRNQPFVDAQRIGIWGCDYGAHIVVHAMLEFPHGFKAGFADAPITDWHKYSAYFTERYLGLPQRHIPEYNDSSALEHARRMTGDLLIAAPEADVHRHALEEEMREVKPAAIAEHFHVFTPASDRYRDNPEHLVELLKTMTEFFDKKL